ncbi:hypothetical protein [Paucihalobacter sp.]|uniref:hypothetical protein n=1 Tax=Paucihalobacter sp. TaxID=2850405 RepID=UPI002FDF1AB3
MFCVKHIVFLLIFSSFSFESIGQTHSSINLGYLSTNSSENYFFKAPLNIQFNDAIFNNENWLVGISNELNGEFIEGTNFQSIELSNSVAISYRFRHFGKGRLGFFGSVGWISGTHHQNFDILYFNPEINDESVEPSRFKSERNIVDVSVGISFNTNSKSNLFIDAGPIIQYVSYNPVTATVRDFSFDYEAKESFIIPGFSISSQLLFNPKSTLALGVYAEGKLLLIDDAMAANFGIGLSVSLNHRKKLPNQQETLIIDQVESVKLPTRRNLPDYWKNMDFNYQLDYNQRKLSTTFPSINLNRKRINDIVFYQFQNDTIYIHNPENHIPEIGNEYSSKAKISSIQNYLIRPNFLLIADSELDNQVNVLSFNTEDTQQTIYVIKDHSYDFSYYYPELERKISDGQSRANKARVAKEAKLNERDSLLRLMDSLDLRYNELVFINKILDNYPDVLGDKIRNILDSIADAGDHSSMANNIITETKNKKNDCENRIAELKSELAKRKNDCAELENAIEKAISKLTSAYLMKMGITAEITLDGEGGYNLKFTGVMLHSYDKTSKKSRDEIRQMRKDLSNLIDALEACKNDTNRLEQAIQDTKNLCDDYDSEISEQEDAINDAADQSAILKSAIEDICESIKKALENLLNKWCEDHPDLCDFKDELKALLNDKCPTNAQEWEDFWNDFNNIINKKKALESKIASDISDTEKDYDDNSKDIDTLDDDLSDALSDISDAQNEIAKKAQAEADAARIAAEEKRKRDAVRANRAKKDQEIKDLIDDIKNGSAGDDAFEDLVELIGLGALDDLTGNTKIGTIIGGLLVLKDQPECVCPIFVALKSALGAAQRGASFEVLAHADDFIKKWKECANLPSLPMSISEGADTLADAIENMTREQRANAINGLESALKLNCK